MTVLLVLTSVISAQEPVPQPRFDSSTTAVVIDVVVRDRKGKPVTDLQKSDFALFDEGIQQEIADLTLVAPPGVASIAGDGSPARGDAAAPASTPGVTDPASFVALVFDRLSPEGRAAASKGARAALAVVDRREFFGVFVNDLKLRTLQTFTNNRAQVEAAIAAASTNATTLFSREADAIRIGGRGDSAPSVSYTAGAESAGRGLTPARPPADRLTDASVASSLKLEAMATRMESTYELLSRDFQGLSTTNGLLAVIAALGPLPGRKTVVFFAESLAIPVAVQATFDAVIENANRANVTIYAIDPAGLRVQSDQGAAGRELRCLSGDLGALNCDDVYAKLKGTGYDAADLRIDALRKDPATALGTLSRATGGFLVNNTNDLARGFEKIDEDRRFHYLLTYTPKNQQFNGDWRKVTVRIPGRKVEVRARSGYTAIRAPGALPFLKHEAPALAALDRVPRAMEVPLRARAFVFPRGADAHVAVLASTAADALTFSTDEGASTYATDFTILARIRDAGGEVVRKASEVYRLTGPASAREQARRGEVLFFRQPTLPPGRYTLEAVVYDALGHAAGVDESRFDVPAAAPLSVASLVVVARGERVAEADRRGDNPLYVGEAIVYPNLGEPIRRSDAFLTLLSTVGVPAGGTVSGRLQVLDGSVPVATLPVPFGPAVNGRIQLLWRVALDAIPAGDYTLRLEVTDGRGTEVRETSVQLIDAH